MARDPAAFDAGARRDVPAGLIEGVAKQGATDFPAVVRFPLQSEEPGVGIVVRVVVVVEDVRGEIGLQTVAGGEDVRRQRLRHDKA